MATRGKIRLERIARVILAVLFIVVLSVVAYLVVKIVRAAGSALSAPKGDVVIVPDVAGLPVAEAEIMLKDRGLVGDIVHRLYDNDIETGHITKQNPSAGAKRKQGAKVSLWESLGPASFTIPKLVGEHIDNIPKKLNDAGLTTGQVKKVFNSKIPKGRVMSQSPEAGREFSSPVPVDVVVSDSEGSAQTTMPAVVGLKLNRAEEQIARANLHLRKVTYMANDSQPQGTVVGQSVMSNSAVEIGTQVELDVALPVAWMAQPNKRVTITVPVPPGPDSQKVKIKVFDNLAPSGFVDYEATHKPGDRIERRIDVEGRATIMIFIEDMENAFREEHL